ncbi:MAG: guanylate kinase [Bacillaceae bacterium]|nr:guanylate kinase [Bacillaceae bacterium]
MYELNDKQLIFVFTGPDGSGRRTIADMVGPSLDMAKVLSYTTRKPRSVEKDGQDYYFVSESQFKQMQDNGEFLESIEYDGHYYGIKESDVASLLEKKGVIYMSLNIEGTRILKDMYQDKVIRIFVYANAETVRKRQEERGTDREEIEKHMSHFEEAMNYKDECEHVFENYDLPQVAYQIQETIEQYLDRNLTESDY